MYYKSNFVGHCHLNIKYYGFKNIKMKKNKVKRYILITTVFCTLDTCTLVHCLLLLYANILIRYWVY